MSNSHNAKLSDVILQALTTKEKARIGLSAISTYPECSQRLRSRTYFLDGKICSNAFFTDDIATELEAILTGADSWIKAGQKKELVWVEGCSHEGWVETFLPDELNDLQQACIPLRQLILLLREALNQVEAIRIANDLTN